MTRDEAYEKYRKQLIEIDNDRFGLVGPWLEKNDECTLTRFAVGTLAKDYFELEGQYKKELHDMAGKIQSAQLTAEVAERKLKDALADNEALKHELFTLQDKIRLKYHGEDDYSEEIK